MRILVTGGAGFIGSHVCDRLISAGHEVLSFDALTNGPALDFTPPGAKRVTLSDVAEFDSLDGIVHCAARADIRHNWAEDGTGGLIERNKLWRSNVDLTGHLLELTLKHRPHVVFMSTGAVYGADTREDAAVKPASPYAASKVAGEALVQAYAAHTKAPYHILRLGRVVGARYHHGHIADFVKQAKETGEILALSSGYAKASCVHVKDVARFALLFLVSRFCCGNPKWWGTLNVATDHMSPRDTARMMGVKATWDESRDMAWPGDVSPYLSAERLLAAGLHASYSAVGGVCDALDHLGWPTQ